MNPDQGDQNQRLKESATRRVSKMLRDDQGRWMKRRSRPIPSTTRTEQQRRKIPTPVYDLTKNPESGIPADVYERLDELVGDAGKPTPWIEQTITTIRTARGNPDAPVEVHTAVPNDRTTIAPGDWVSLAKGFAEARARAYPRWRTITATVPAYQILSRSDDLLRWTWKGREPIENGTVSTEKRYARARTD